MPASDFIVFGVDDEGIEEIFKQWVRSAVGVSCKEIAQSNWSTVWVGYGKLCDFLFWQFFRFLRDVAAGEKVVQKNRLTLSDFM
jgi:hypothetical protein